MSSIAALEAVEEGLRHGMQAGLKREAQLFGQLAEVAQETEDWRERIRGGTQAFLEVLAAEPDFARSFMIEVLSVGEEALARRAEIHERFAGVLAETYEAAQAQGAGLGPVPPWVFRAAAGAAWELIVEHLRTCGVDGLLELAPRIEQIHLALLRGDFTDV